MKLRPRASKCQGKKNKINGLDMQIPLHPAPQGKVQTEMKVILDIVI